MKPLDKRIILAIMFGVSCTHALDTAARTCPLSFPAASVQFGARSVKMQNKLPESVIEKLLMTFLNT